MTSDQTMVALAKADMLARVFTFYSDPEHGWLQVTLADINAVDLIVGSISRYSYRKNTTFYLEEDCDAGKFIDAYRAKFGQEAQIAINNNGGLIRNLPRLDQ